MGAKSMSDRTEIELFRPHEGTSFTIRNGSEAASQLELIEVKSLKIEDDNRDSQFRAEPFRLTFRSPKKTEYYEQQMFKLSHEVLGELDMFLVPIGPDDEGMLYEAVFN